MIDIILFKILVVYLGLPRCLDRDKLIITEHQEVSCYIESDTTKTIFIENEMIFMLSYGVRLI